MTDETLPTDRAKRVEVAAQWLADQPFQSRPVPVLRERFNLTAAEACQAIGRANQMRVCRSAFS